MFIVFFTLLNISILVHADDNTHPMLNFVSPTPNDEASQSIGIVILNTSVIEENLTSLTYNWDGTNTTIYDDSLVLMYNFDNKTILGEDSTTVIDMSTNTNTATFSTSPDLDSGYSSLGKYNGAWMFDGDDYLEAGDVFDFTGTQAFSVSAWIKKASTVASQHWVGIVNKFSDIQANGGNTGWLIGINSDQHFFFDRWEAGTESCSKLEISLENDVWYHVVGTYNGTHIKTYLNAEFGDSSESTFSLSDRTDNLRVGGRSDGWENAFFDGTIDEVRIWNRCLTDEEIYIQYASNLNKINQTHWNYNITQKKNTTEELDIGTYTYQIFAEDINSNTAQTDQRSIEITGPTPPVPEATTLALIGFGSLILLGLFVFKKRVI